MLARRIFPEGPLEPVLGRAPQPGRLCVTVSESKDCIARLGEVETIEITGEKLLKKLAVGHEIVVVYEDGGDYMTREQLAWYRQLMEDKQ